MEKNSILLVIAALLAVMAFAGNAAAHAEPVYGTVDTAADQAVVMLWVEDDRINNPGQNMSAIINDSSKTGLTNKSYYFDDIEPILLAHGKNIDDPFNVTVAMLCSGQNQTGVTYTNTYHNDTGVNQSDTYGNAGATIMPMLNLTACPTETHPDLIVASITPNCGGYLFGNESNTISAKIENIGNGTAVASTACFVLSDGHSATASVSQLAPGANETVTITDPTDRDAGDTVTITVTADCNDTNPAEWNESNNVTTKDVTVVNNGYKGKTYTGGSNMTTWKTYDLNGNLVYSAGDSYYLSSYYHPSWTTYNVSWTASDLSVTGTVVEARLYAMYTWDKKDVMSNNVNLTFNGNDQTVDEHYQDEKMFASSYPYGMLAYNVTDDFNAAGNYANLTNSHTGGDNVSMRGMMLVTIYENASEPRRLIYVNEEFDMLYGGSGKCTTPDEATAWAPITGPSINNTATIANATLITVAPGAGPNEGELIFNGQVWNDVWNFAGTNGSQIGIDERDVASYLQSTDNLVGFQSSADYMEASNAFLVLEKRDKVVVSCAEPTYEVSYNHSGMATVNISLNGIADYGTGTIHLYFDRTVVDTNLSMIGMGDSTSITPTVSQGHVEISASNTDGVDNPTFATVTFYPTGSPGDCCTLNLTVETLYDRNYVPMQTVVQNSTICIVEHQKPTVTCQAASPPVILNDTMRARAQYPTGYPYSTNMSNLSVHVTDATNVTAVYIDLTPLGSGIVQMDGPDGAMEGNWYCNKTNALYASLTPYDLNVMAVDCHGNWNNETNISLEVQRRGDVTGNGNVHDNKVTVKDYLYIARYTVDLEPEHPDHFHLVGEIQPANNWDGIDMADALYIAMYVADPSSYPAP